MNSEISKVQYEKLLDEHYSSGVSSNKNLWTSKQIENIIKMIETYKTASNPGRLRKKYYYYSRNYEIETRGSKKLLLRKKKYKNVKIHILPKEEFYSLLNAVHVATLHGGPNKMYDVIKYKIYIPRPAIQMFVKCCTHCSKQKRKCLLRRMNSSGNSTIYANSSINNTISYKIEYNDLLIKYFKNDLQNSIWTKENLHNLIYNLKHETGGHVEKLKKKLKIVSDSEDQEYIVWKRGNNIFPKLIPIDEYFDILHEIHMISYHGDFGTIREYFYGIFHIPPIAIQLYLKCCDKCKDSLPDINYNFDRKLVTYSANINLIEVTDDITNEKKWLLIYHYMETNFVQLYPLFLIEPKVIAINLFQIFMEYGIPKVLQTDNKTLSFESIVIGLKDLLFDCNLNIEEYKYDPLSLQKNRGLYIKIKDMLEEWLSENPNSSLSLGCNFVQEALNSPQFDRTTVKDEIFVAGINPIERSVNIDPTEVTSDVDIKSENISLDSDNEV